MLDGLRLLEPAGRSREEENGGEQASSNGGEMRRDRPRDENEVPGRRD